MTDYEYTCNEYYLALKDHNATPETLSAFKNYVRNEAKDLLSVYGAFEHYMDITAGENKTTAINMNDVQVRYTEDGNLFLGWKDQAWVYSKTITAPQAVSILQRMNKTALINHRYWTAVA